MSLLPYDTFLLHTSCHHHLFNISIQPAVCTRELCVFSFYTLGVMSGAAEEVATGAEVVDLLVAMCRAALESPRKSIIFEPYPSVVDPTDPKTLAFNPKKKNYERLQKALDSVMSIREMTQGSYLEITCRLHPSQREREGALEKSRPGTLPKCPHSEPLTCSRTPAAKHKNKFHKNSIA